MKKKNIFTLLIILILTVSFTFTGCSRSNNNDVDFDGGEIDETKQYTIEFSGWGDYEEQQNYQILINQFMNENKNITVAYTPVDASSYMTNLKNRANNLPDVFYMPDTEFLQWADSGKLMNIKAGVNETELSKIWSEASEKYYYNRDTYSLGNTEGSKLYGLPKDLGPFTLVCNETLLNNLAIQKGLKAEDLVCLSADEPMDWTEFRTLLKKLDTDPNDDIYGISHYEIEAAVYSNNANFFTGDTKTEKITDNNFTDALQFIADLYLTDKVMPSPDDQASTNGYQRFKGGKAVFSFMGPWDCANFWTSVNFDYNIYPVPYGLAEGAQSIAWVGSMAYSVSAKSQSPEAAILLAKYLSFSENAQRKAYELGQQVPNIIEMANDEYINNSLELLKNNNPANRNVFVNTMDGFKDSNDNVGGKARATYYTYDSLWYTDFTDILKDLWSGKQTAQTLMQGYKSEYQEKLTDMISQYQG
jgi:multiple sugar transport system substrate-binding protein